MFDTNIAKVKESKSILISKDKIIDFISNLIKINPEFSSAFLPHSSKLSNGASEIGLRNIEYIISAIRGDFNLDLHIVGINKGGNFLSTYFSHRLNLDEKYIIKCDYRVDYKKIKFAEERPEIEGALIIIDDVVRTGETILAVREYLSKKYLRQLFLLLL
jgi:phosphoribosylpyrophosphate synthetase